MRSRSRFASSNSHRVRRFAARFLSPGTTIEERWLPPRLSIEIRRERVPPVNVIVCGTPRSGMAAACSKGTWFGRLSRRARTQSMWRLRKLPASSRSHWRGSVTMTARRVRLTRSVKRRAPGCRRTSNCAPMSSRRTDRVLELRSMTRRPFMILMRSAPKSRRASK